MCLIAAVPLVAAVGTTMTAAQAISLGMSAASVAVSALGAYSQASSAKATANYNASVAEQQAQNALRRGDEQMAASHREASKAGGQARAGYGARGVDINAGTPYGVTGQIDFFGASDEVTARNNAKYEAWGYRSRAAGFQGEANAQNPLLAASTTLLGGASLVADKWYRYKG